MLPLIVLSCSAKGILQKGFPLGGKKTASSLSRKRLMRGDKSALSIGCIFPRSGTTHGSFPTRFHFWWVRLTASALCRGAIRRERPAFQPALRPSTNPNHFYPVAERSDSCPNPARRDLARSSRNSQHGKRLHRICTM